MSNISGARMMQHFTKENRDLHEWRAMEVRFGHALTYGEFKAEQRRINEKIAALWAMIERFKSYKAEIPACVQ